MLERFDDTARRALVIARAKAAASGAGRVEVAHLLLGLASDPSNGVREVLTRCGVNLHTLTTALSGRGANDTHGSGTLQLTAEARHLLELAAREAARLHQDRVGALHLLMAVHDAEPDGPAAKVLDAFGAIRARLRAEALDALGNPPGEPGPPRSSGDRPAPAGVTRTPGRVGDVSARPRRSGERSVLAQFARNLTEEAAEGRIDPVIGRDRELERVMAVLSRRTKNNPVLVGDPGVGKTAVVEGFALAVAEGRVPEHFAGAQVYSLEMATLVAGTSLRGDLEERVKRIAAEVARRPEVILFIDEIHTLVSSSSGRLDVANIVKPLLARGELTTIGATTAEEYSRYFEADKALARRFQRIVVDEPSPADAVRIIAGLRAAYEEHHRVRVTDDAVAASVRLAKRYQPDRFLPDSAIDLLDEAGARAAIARLADPDRPGVVDADDVAEVLAAATGLPVARLTDDDIGRLIGMEEHLARRVVGQRDAVAAVSRAVRRGAVGFGDERRPTGSFVFCGPTGVGKTELAKALAEFLFGDDTALITFDMSEYMERHTVSRLVGAPPGYSGHDEGGQLTEAVRRRPYSVVLFDEVEKAHPAVFDVLLQVLEEGRLTDASGRAADFSNTVIIMTSNLGADALRAPAVGFTSSSRDVEAERVRRRYTDALRRHFRPEFLNRVDEVVCFSELTVADVTEITSMMCAELAGRVAATGRTLEVTDAALGALAAAGYDPEMGARPLRRVVTAKVEDPISEGLLAGAFEEGATIVVDVSGGDVVVVSVPALTAPEPEPVH